LLEPRLGEPTMQAGDEAGAAVLPQHAPVEGAVTVDTGEQLDEMSGRGVPLRSRSASQEPAWRRSPPVRSADSPAISLTSGVAWM
jgi:hypothetical protein